VHRLRALDLLSRFLDHGPNAVSLVSILYSPIKLSCIFSVYQSTYLTFFSSLCMSFQCFILAGIVCGNIPVRTETAAELSKRAQTSPSLYLGKDSLSRWR